ncbi:hypothetical protein D3C72_1438280 [compost metagenome]
MDDRQSRGQLQSVIAARFRADSKAKSFDLSSVLQILSSLERYRQLLPDQRILWRIGQAAKRKWRNCCYPPGIFHLRLASCRPAGILLRDLKQCRLKLNLYLMNWKELAGSQSRSAAGCYPVPSQPMAAEGPRFLE